MTDVRPVDVAGQKLGDGRLFFIAGPCVLESRALAFDIAGALKDLFSSRGVPFVFKASYDKANRSSLSGGRGVGAEEGLAWLADIRTELGLPTLTDVHQPDQCRLAAEAVDVLQIPAFLCRQTDLLVAAAETGKVVNVKKGQFLAPWDMGNVAKKITDSGNPNVLLTERGVTHGYGRLVVDMTGFREMRATGHPVVFDATHSVQRPGALGTSTGGDRTLAPPGPISSPSCGRARPLQAAAQACASTDTRRTPIGRDVAQMRWSCARLQPLTIRGGIQRARRAVPGTKSPAHS
jgi:2-dehydro-3-deoxyphosphooctonate aldolase (KDO 8-P synthase)